MPDTTAVPATKPGPSIKTVKDLLTTDLFKRQIALALPKTFSSDRFMRVALTLYNRVPGLAECTVQSVAQCLLDCAQLGLEPGLLGRAWLVPFRDHGVPKATLIIGYQGLAELAFRSGRVKALRAEAVYEQDDFECALGSDPKLVHKPYLGAEDPGRLLYAYAVATLEGGATQWVVLTRRQLDAIRASSKSGKGGKPGPWDTHFPEMCTKSAVRKLSKLLPLSPEISDAFEAEDRSHRDAGAFVEANFELLPQEPAAGPRPTPAYATPPAAEASPVDPATNENEAAAPPPASGARAQMEGEAGKLVAQAIAMGRGDKIAVRLMAAAGKTSPRPRGALKLTINEMPDALLANYLEGLRELVAAENVEEKRQ